MAGAPGSGDPVHEAVFRRTRQPFLVLDAECNVLFVNPAFRAWSRSDPEALAGRPLWEIGGGCWDTPELRRLMSEVADTGRAADGVRALHSAGGERRMAVVSADAIDAGGTRRLLLAIDDVTGDEAAVEFERKVFDAVREGLLVLDRSLRVLRANDAFAALSGVPAGECVGRLVYELGDGQWDIPELRRLLEEVLPRDSAFDDLEVALEHAPAGRRVLLLNARRIDHVQMILLAFRDATEERRAQERQAILIGELQHRVKNILNNVHALLRQTRRSSVSVDHFVDLFEGRMRSLARMQDMLIEGWGRTIPLGHILRAELSAQAADEGERVVLEGGDVALRAEQAQALTMAVHELVTNAAKYGALSRDGGHVAVAWTVAPRDGQDWLDMVWRETGVPIPAPPTHRGFGSEVIARSLPYLLGGASEMVYHPDGLECRMSFPLGNRD